MSPFTQGERSREKAREIDRDKNTEKERKKERERRKRENRSLQIYNLPTLLWFVPLLYTGLG